MKNTRTDSTKASARTVLSRRDFFKISMAATGALALPILAGCLPEESGAMTFLQPKEIRSVKMPWSKYGVLETSLLVKLKPVAIPGAKTPQLVRMYGSPRHGATADPEDDTQWHWSFPGPTLRIKPLDTVKIKLYNRLPIEENPGECNPLDAPTPGPAGQPTPTPFPPPQYPECFHADNVTNLHFHGFHVDQGRRPDGKYGDDVFLALYPHGQEHLHEEKGIHNEIGEVDFEFVVPDSQARGTFWYHPHNHGSTDLQVTNGMAGAFIVEDTLDDHFPDAKPSEYVLVIQDIAETVKFGFGGANNPTTLINGQVTPNIPMKAGEVQRWRLINATGQGSNIYTISFEGSSGKPPKIYLISADGIFIDNKTWDKESPVDSIYLAPGNRIDFLVKAIDEGNFSLNATSLQVQRPGPGGGAGNGGNNPTPTIPPDTPGKVKLVSTTVSGIQTPAMELPETLPLPVPESITVLNPILDSEIVNKEPITVKFSMMRGTAQGQSPVFQIDGRSFDPCYIGHCMVVDTAEEWTITNSTTLAHPFHIHLNPFYIKEFYDPQGGLPDPRHRWQDTVIIPPASADGQTPGKVVIRHRFPEIVDKFVIHCHILGHEDRGMMQVVEVVKDAKDCKSDGCPVE